MSLHVTGFTAFGRFADNPAARLAERCRRPYTLLEVSFAAVDAFLGSVAGNDDVDALLMLGVADRRTHLKIERVARNMIGETGDVRGEVRGPGPIDPDGPAELTTTLFPATVPLDVATCDHLSNDCGCYLCNYAFYQALRRLPQKRVGFVHVPPVEAMPLEAQQRELERLIALASDT
jgi:pyrrolidone-carboxylate peptidase